MVYAPIWKDTYYTTTAESLTYAIKDSGGNSLFLGHAVRFPGNATMDININNICRNYMSNDLPDSMLTATASTSVTNTEACKEFKLYSGSTLLETYRFLWDWSYEDWNGGSKSMSYPINGHNNGNMLVFSSSVASNVVTNSVVIGNGMYCGQLAFYYQSKAGGWDSFLCEGSLKRTDNLTRYEYSKAIRNTTKEFESTVYSEDVSSSYQVYTGWLTDGQAKRLAENLLQSTRVYAHDLENDVVFPVTIVDANIEHKTWRNQGRKKPVNYVINFKASQTRVRR